MAEPTPTTIKPLNSLMGKICIGLWISIGFDVLQVPTSGALLFFQSAGAGAKDTLDLFSGLDALATVGTCLAILVTGIMSCMWLARAYGNLMAAQVQGLKYTPFWVIGYWFVPIVSLVMPFRVVRELWAASDPNVSDDSWKNAKPPSWMRWWWAMWLISSLISNASGRLNGAPAEIASIIETPFGIAAALLFMRVLREIWHRQLHKLGNEIGPLN